MTRILHSISTIPLVRIFVAAGVLAVAPFPRIASADLIRLKSGGEVRGEVDRKKSRPSQPQVFVTTMNGIEVVLDRTEIEFLTYRPHKVEVHETLARKAPDTVEGQWKMAEWCREQKLDQQREEHLERIVELDPDHLRAHRGLGHTERGGKWMSRDEVMTAAGYVKYKNRYITPQELALIEKTEAEQEAEQEWFQNIRLWKGWLTGRNEDRRTNANIEFLKIRDPNAVNGLVKAFQDDDSKLLRNYYVGILAKIGGAKPVKPLVAQSLHDVDYEVRYNALNALKEDQFEEAMPHFVEALKEDDNVVVRRGGRGLARVGDERVVPELIAALNTTHRYRVRVPKESTSFTNGNYGSPGVVLPPEIEGLLRAGQLPNGVIVTNNQPVPTKLVTIKYTHQNSEVHAALQKITGESFGYDERTWRLWRSASKTSAADVPKLEQ